MFKYLTNAFIPTVWPLSEALNWQKRNILYTPSLCKYVLGFYVITKNKASHFKSDTE